MRAEVVLGDHTQEEPASEDSVVGDALPVVGEDLVEEGEELASGDLAIKGKIGESVEPLAETVHFFVLDLLLSLVEEEGLLYFEDIDGKVDLLA